MSGPLILEAGQDSFTLLDLIRKAADHVGVIYHEGGKRAHSETIVSYPIDDATLKFLSTQGFEHEFRDDGVLTIAAHKGYWNYRFRSRDERPPDDLVMQLCVGFSLDPKGQGIGVVPLAHGTFFSPASESPANLQMFRSLVKLHPDAPEIVRKIVEDHGHVRVTWTELGLGGVLRIYELFDQFAAGNDRLKHLARNTMSPFDPAPYDTRRQPGEVLYFSALAQAKVLDAWAGQLQGFHATLASA